MRVFDKLIPFREVPSNKGNHRLEKFYTIILWGAIETQKSPVRKNGALFVFNLDARGIGFETVVTPTKNESGKKPVEAGFSSQGVFLEGNEEKRIPIRGAIETQKSPVRKNGALFVFNLDARGIGVETVVTPTKNESGKKPVEAGFSSQGVFLEGNEEKRIPIRGAIFIKTAIDCLKVGNLFCTPKWTLELNLGFFLYFSLIYYLWVLLFSF